MSSAPGRGRSRKFKAPEIALAGQELFWKIDYSEFRSVHRIRPSPNHRTDCRRARRVPATLRVVVVVRISFRAVDFHRDLTQDFH